jgi:hypothetical protein
LNKRPIGDNLENTNRREEKNESPTRRDVMSEKKSVWGNFTTGQTWLRGLFMLLFVLIYGFTEVIITAVVLLQFLFVLFSGEQNKRLREFGARLSVYVYRIIAYWTYNSEEMPFPFAPWPADEEIQGGVKKVQKGASRGKRGTKGSP